MNMDNANMIGDNGMMMAGMGFVCLLSIVALILAIAALIKYLRS